MTGAARAALLSGALAACARAPAAPACDADLRGVYRDDAGAPWMLLDHGATLEAYPLVADASRAADARGPLYAAPRVLDLTRTAGPGGARLAGELSRRFEQGGQACRTRAPATVTRCDAAGLELVLGEPAPPLAFAPCRPGGALPARRVRWRRG